MSRELMNPIDLTLLRMDNPNNLMIITGIMIFNGHLDIDRVKDAIRTPLHKFRRLQQRIIQPPLPFMTPYWEDDPNFDLEKHIDHITLPPPGDQTALQDLVSTLMSTDLDRERPLWHFYIIDDYQGGSALIVRLHHSIADGISLTKVLLSMTDLEPDAVREHDSVEIPRRTSSSRDNGELPLSRELDTALRLFSRALTEGLLLLTDREHAVTRLNQAFEFSSAVAKLALRWPDPQTPLKGTPSYQKRAAWSLPVELDHIKLIGDNFGGTVNDVLLTAVAGALREYLQSRHEPVEGLDIRGFIPVNLRPVALDEEIGNKFGMVFLSLPLGIEDPFERYLVLKHRMDSLKSSYEAVAGYGILGILGYMPRSIQNMLTSIFDSKGTAVMTNVPGPQQTLYLAGAPIKTVMAWVPQSGRISLGVSIFSYMGKVWLGIASDASLVPDPERIIALFEVEFQAMLTRAREMQSRRNGTIRPMLERLEAALEDLDKFLENTSQPSTPDKSPSSSPERCQAQTKSGQQCKNSALPGGVFCHVHSH